MPGRGRPSRRSKNLNNLEERLFAEAGAKPTSTGASAPSQCRKRRHSPDEPGSRASARGPDQGELLNSDNDFTINEEPNQHNVSVELSTDALENMIKLAVNQATAPLIQKIESLQNSVATNDSGRLRPLYIGFDKKIIESVRDNAFIDLKTLINADEIDTAITYAEDKDGHLVPSTVKGKDRVLSIDNWTKAFTRLISITQFNLSEDPENALKIAQEMLAYMETIRHIAIESDQIGWQKFDEEFRRLIANDKTTSWSNINNVLWLKTFLKKKVTTKNEKREEKTQASNTVRPCRYFNTKRGCIKKNCEYHHSCSECGKSNHSVQSCFAKPFGKPEYQKSKSEARQKSPVASARKD